MKSFIRENTWMNRTLADIGWGNGYVLIPKGHPLHSKHYDHIDVDVHGGLTFSTEVTEEMAEEWGLDKEDVGMWCVGFDTAHTGDNLRVWPKNRVQAEADRLRKQILYYKINVNSLDKTI
jgi:hypothetical protein